MKRRYAKYFSEDITIPLSPGDNFLYGKFKNRVGVVDKFDKNDKGEDVIITNAGKEVPLLKIRLVKERYKKYFDESLKISDLKAHAGISDFTKYWKNERQRLKGTANKSAKLLEVEINKEEDWVEFRFSSEPTYKFDTQVTVPEDMHFQSDNLYTEQIRFLQFFELFDTEEYSIKNIKDALKTCDVKVWCDCPSFHWQGDNFVISQFDASIHPTDIVPKHWNKYHNDDNFVCKHLSMILSQIEFFIPIMASMVFKRLK
jgi:hypothetical protein